MGRQTWAGVVKADHFTPVDVLWPHKEDSSASKDNNSALLLHWGRAMEAYMLLFLLAGLQFGKELGNCWCPLQSTYRHRCESRSVSCAACARHKVGADSRDVWLIIQHNIDEGWPVGSFHSFIMSDVSWLWIDYCHKRAGLSSHRLWKWTCCTRYMKSNSVLKYQKEVNGGSLLVNSIYTAIETMLSKCDTCQRHRHKWSSYGDSWCPSSTHEEGMNTCLLRHKGCLTSQGGSFQKYSGWPSHLAETFLFL